MKELLMNYMSTIQVKILTVLHFEEYPKWRPIKLVRIFNIKTASVQAQSMLMFINFVTIYF